MYRKSSFKRSPLQDLFIHWQQMDWPILFLAVGLTFFGGVMIRSTGLNKPVAYWLQHWSFGAIGLAIAFAIARISYNNLLRWHWVTYGLTNGLLVAVDFMGSSAKGAQRWISIAGFNMQPSEFAKVGMIITLAAILHRRPANTLPTFFSALAIMIPPWLLVFIQPDLGTSLVFGAIALGMLYWANAKPGWLLLLVSPLASAILDSISQPAWIAWAVLMGVVAWFTLPMRWVTSILAIAMNIAAGMLGQVLWHVLKDYQKARIVVFLDPDKYPLGAGYHLIQSRIAIGAGEFWGQGLNQGTQTQLNFIPEQHTDFIFSAIGEELGFVGAICLLATFFVLCWRMLRVASQAPNNFGSLLAIGVLLMISFQVVVNISMTIGIAPVTGIPLPWISYGGSALITNFVAIGLVESVANYRRKFTV
ncbi:rod shape-determining protein RodA [Chamaesiphon minutus]|uniref:Peptidoglycan glycosyltransferase RodA n=1 Tax=Chamaesiphon minutus (strain ATCC 27169 / PCC 6605) TaxID=1173020 RepID=K9UB10_CHAP6|nr:rod shape-determining protein RodA [Chamaesiphon minutus]AFY92035.1 rod shape-determining protein RodA [Chamaesiphon minutus PCC 6605]